jgi:hypothetical protein
MPIELDRSDAPSAPAAARTYVVFALGGESTDFATPLGTVIAAGRRAAGDAARRVYGARVGAYGTLRVVAAGSVAPGLLVRALMEDGERMVA